VDCLGASVDEVIKDRLNQGLKSIEDSLDRDTISIYGPIFYGLDNVIRQAVEAIDEKRPHLAIVLDTPGGIAEVVERIVHTVRHFYDDVTFIIPDKAMSAGTILAMSGDQIMMDYFSRLGPIDPQVEKDGKLVPARSYLIQYERLIQKDRQGELTNAEFVLLNKFDLAELHQYEQAEKLSHTLLTQWLTKYKFKNWIKTETRQKTVTPKMRKDRALEIAKALNDNELWHSHGRGISKESLESEKIKLRIDDLASTNELHEMVLSYFHCLRDYILQKNYSSFVHTRKYF